jgi:hypothetical protein
MTDYLNVLISTVVAFITSYGTIVYKLNKEKNKGKIIVNELIKRYFISCLNCVDQNTNKVKSDSLSKDQHLRVIQRIEQDLLELQNNLYYSAILEKYPHITKTQIAISREIEKLKKEDFPSLDLDTIDEFHCLYQLIKSDLPKKTKTNKHFKEINQMIEEFYGIIKQKVR